MRHGGGGSSNYPILQSHDKHFEYFFFTSSRITYDGGADSWRFALQYRAASGPEVLEMSKLLKKNSL